MTLAESLGTGGVVAVAMLEYVGRETNPTGGQMLERMNLIYRLPLVAKDGPRLKIIAFAGGLGM